MRRLMERERERIKTRGDDDGRPSVCIWFEFARKYLETDRHAAAASSFLVRRCWAKSV
jgi:hypothetical protein